MKFSWLFGSSMAARHTLFAYVLVWAVQGGYAAWIFYQWLRVNRSSPSAPDDHRD